MNPFKDIDPKKGLRENDKSPFYGRFCLNFDQVAPFNGSTSYFNENGYSPIAFIPIKKGKEQDVLLLYEMFPERVQSLLHCYRQNQNKVIKNTWWMDECFGDGDYFLVLEMTGDFIYIGIENLYFALLELSEFLEDCHFFVYSSGYRYIHWLDEYIIKNGELTLLRHLLEIEAYYGRLHFYIKRALQHPGDESLKHFALDQIINSKVFSFFVKKVDNITNEKNLMKVKTKSPDLYKIYQDYKKLKNT